ncbi:hypothetical protein ACSBQY_07405 [Micrococcus lylae]|uniref:hypothetical protein n=1 Tax=Micrococcus lylae TaxID=1273 RepID=UPI003EB76D88
MTSPPLTHRPPRILAAAAALLLALAGCGGQDAESNTPAATASGSPSQTAPAGSGESTPTPNPEEPSMSAETTATRPEPTPALLERQQQLLEEQLPAVMDAIDTSGLRDLAQVSCTGPVDPRSDEGPGATRWLFSLRKGVPDLDAAKTTAEPARAYLEQHGWTVEIAERLDPKAPVNTLWNAQHTETGLALTAEYDHGGGESVLITHGGGGCIEIPRDQLMVRSPLDSGFGDGSPGYDQDAERADPDYREPTFHPDAGPATRHRGVGD